MIIMEQKTWPLKLGIVTLLVTIFPWSYWVYGLGKILVCAIASYYAYCNHSSGKKQTKTFWYFLAVAIIFNPLLPLHLFFSVLWIIVDIGVAAFFWSYLKQLKHEMKPPIKETKSLEKTSMSETSTVDSPKSGTHKYSITAQIQSHLEFLGYKAEFIEEAKADGLICRSENRSTLIIRIVNDTVMIGARFNSEIKKKADSIELYKAFNEINSKAVASHWYKEKDTDEGVVFSVETCCFGYDKNGFGQLIDLFQSEIRNLMGVLVALEG